MKETKLNKSLVNKLIEELPSLVPDKDLVRNFKLQPHDQYCSYYPYPDLVGATMKIMKDDL